ncbi:MAG: cobalamin-binding protein [Firmicutes bacterium]|nr:cobalamin-binding protein [Bacillota bacterium]
MKKSVAWGLFILLILLAASGCSSSFPEDTEGGLAEDEQKEIQSAGEFPLTVEDYFGRQVEILQKPERIISLAPSNTELLFALGLEKRIVGVTEYCNFPPEALDKPKAGSFSEPYLEQIISLQPDLVVASELLVTGEVLEQLEGLDFPVLVLHPSGIEEVCQVLELLGAVTGEKEKAAGLITEMEARLAAVQEKLQQLPAGERVRVYYEVYADPLMTAGSISVIHEIIGKAGGENIFADVETAFPRVSPEAVIERDPEIILYSDQHGSEGTFDQEITNRPGWETISALQEERIFGLNADKFTRPGPRLAEAVEELAKIFYPELWPEP